MPRTRRPWGRIAALLTLIFVASAAAKGLQPGTTAQAAGAPVVYWVSPTFARAGTSVPFTITFWGTNIDATTVAQWDGVDQPSVRFEEVSLDMTIQPAMVASAGNHTIRLRTGAEFSSAFTFNVIGGSSPHPSIDGMSASTVAAAKPFNLFVRGRDFEAGAAITLNGNPVPTRHLGETWLFAPNLFFASPQTVVVGVTNPAPGGGPQTFTLNLQVQAPSNVAPTLNLGPATVPAGSPGFLLTASIIGQAQLGSVVQLNGVDLPTMQFESNSISAFVSASMVASPGTLSVRLKAPDGTLGPVADLTVNNSSPGAPPAPSTFSTFRQGEPAGQVIFFSSGTGPGAYMTIDNIPIPSMQRGAPFFAAAIPDWVYATPGLRLVKLVNPGAGGGTSPALELFIYSRSDEDCSQSVTAEDALFVLQYLAGLDPQSGVDGCFVSNPDGLGPNTPVLADATFILREIAGLNEDTAAHP